LIRKQPKQSDYGNAINSLRSANGAR
jgi:hypothetical protein